MLRETGEIGARRIRIRGVVQGVGFRPHVYRLAGRRGLEGWVLNAGEGVEIHVEGSEAALAAFVSEVERAPPPAARIASLETTETGVEGYGGFEIRASPASDHPTVRISPDLPVCEACLAELLDPADRRSGYPYINCTDCGPRYSIVLGLPYDRPATTMKDWPLCGACAAEYGDPADRRFHAQPVACPECGPGFLLLAEGDRVEGSGAAISEAVRRLGRGGILAVKGLGGYHLACDARDPKAVGALRRRKFRKEKPFAIMARDLATARSLGEMTPEAEALLRSPARPIVIVRARRELEEISPGNPDLGLMLPYTPLHHLLFARGAPEALVMTSANRSSEPIAYGDEEAQTRLSGIADAFLVGERPIARRVEDSVMRPGSGRSAPTVLRRARGLAPGVVARIPIDRPVLAVGADLKNTVTLVIEGEALMSPHLGDLDHFESLSAFREAIEDLLSVYAVGAEDLLVVHDAHPQYASTLHAAEIPAGERRSVQHHRAHVASVLAERGTFDRGVLGVALDGTGWGDDGTIWGSEIFAGSVREGFERVAHLYPSLLPGGDAAARHPVQAAAGFLSELDSLPDLSAPPFSFPDRYARALELVEKGVRSFRTTSAGRLFDTVAALLGFTREITFEGQAAIWLEHLAAEGKGLDLEQLDLDPPAFDGRELDWRSLLGAVITARREGREPAAVARGFHQALARGLGIAIIELCRTHDLETVALSGGVFQNRLLLGDLRSALEGSGLEICTHREVPPNDGGISLGQAAMALCEPMKSPD